MMVAGPGVMSPLEAGGWEAGGWEAGGSEAGSGTPAQEMVHWAVIPSAEAVMSTLWAAEVELTLVTRPLASTVAQSTLELVQVTWPSQSAGVVVRVS